MPWSPLLSRCCFPVPRHPVFAAKRCDPDGDYVRRWCPELAKLPVEFIHCPWEARPSVLAGAGVQLRRVTWSRSGRHPAVPARGYPSRCITDLAQVPPKNTLLGSILTNRVSLALSRMGVGVHGRRVLSSPVRA